MKIAVVHLARRQNPPDAFSKFWKSYLDYNPGADHDLIIVWKNFVGVEHPQIPEHEDIQHLVVSDKGCDIDVYFAVSKMFDYDAFVFLNSWAKIQKDNWLKIMRASLQENIGLVGAFSTRESHRTNLLEGYKKAWEHSSLWKRFRASVHFVYYWLRLGIRVPAYPNLHVRTNGFMIRRDVMQKVRKPVLWDKVDALVFESGSRSLTRQIQENGYAIATLDELKLMTDNRVRN